MRTDDPEEVAAAYQRHAADLQRYATYLLHTAVGADDIAHEAFLRLVRTPRTVDDVGAFLRTTVRNLVIDGSARRRRLHVVDDLPATSDPRAELAFDSADLSDLWAAIGTLSPQQLNCAVLHFQFDLTINEIADELGCRRSTVKNHLARAIAKLGEGREVTR